MSKQDQKVKAAYIWKVKATYKSFEAADADRNATKGNVKVKWRRKTNTFDVLVGTKVKKEDVAKQVEVAKKFADKLNNSIKDLDPKHAELVDDNFWDLV